MAFADVDPRLWQFNKGGHVSTGNSSTSWCSAALTHGNRGAYWEAGFAEGLDLPVIRRDLQTKCKPVAK